MKKLLLTLGFFSLSLFSGEPLKELFDLFEIDKENSIEDTQKQWLRKGERWELKDQHPEKREQAFPLFRELGMIDEITPSKTYYDYAIIPGSLLTSVIKRLLIILKKD